MKRRPQFFFALLAMVAIAAMYTTATAGGAGKVVICHHNQNDPTEPEWVTIEVLEKAVPAHLAHGHVLGACAAE